MKFYASFPITADNCLTNRAISYGDGVFETMLVVGNKLPLWDFHYQRLQTSLAKLNLPAIEKTKLLRQIMAIVGDDKTENTVKLVVFRKKGKRGYASDTNQVDYFITINPYCRVESFNQLSVSKIQLSHQKNLAGLKHLNRLEQVLAANELINSNYQDAIMLDNNKHVIETISKNIILIKNNKLYTPKLNKAGVYGVALRWLQAQGYDLIWKKIEFSKLDKYHAMIVCNSIQGFTAINNINNKIQFETNLPLIKEIQLNWETYLNN